MKNKKGVATPIIDIWAIAIYCLLIVILMVLFMVMGGCDRSFDISEIRTSETEVTANNLLLTFLQTPINQNIPNIPGQENIADLIVISENNATNTDKLDNLASDYFTKNYQNKWKLRILYPYGADIIEFEIGRRPMFRIMGNTKTIINSLTSSAFSKIKDEIEYPSAYTKSVIKIPTKFGRPILIELYVYRYPTYPIFNHFRYKLLATES